MEIAASHMNKIQSDHNTIVTRPLDQQNMPLETHMTNSSPCLEVLTNNRSLESGTEMISVSESIGTISDTRKRISDGGGFHFTFPIGSLKASKFQCNNPWLEISQTMVRLAVDQSAKTGGFRSQRHIWLICRSSCILRSPLVPFLVHTYAKTINTFQKKKKKPSFHAISTIHSSHKGRLHAHRAAMSIKFKS
jgi:hypothetical protein